jgi:hypothetical protein
MHWCIPRCSRMRCLLLATARSSRYLPLKLGSSPGEVEITNRLDEGTRVTVHLPSQCQIRRSVNDSVKLMAETKSGRSRGCI